MTENRFMWCSVDGGENLTIKDKKAESDIHIRLIDGKYEFIELMKTINELNDENCELKFQLNMSNKVIEKLKKDIKMILDMSKEEQQELWCYFHILGGENEQKV